MKLKSVALILMLGCLSGLGQEKVTTGTAATTHGVYLIAYRTPGHVRTSSPDVFHSAAADLRKLLEEKRVELVRDSERGFIENESQMSVESMTKLAKEAGAASLLLLTVDRPASKWIKLTLRSYSLDGKLLWEDNVDSGMSPMNGTAGYKKCFEKLGKSLPARIGGPGSPVMVEAVAEKKL